jgi:hypothetical protein
MNTEDVTPVPPHEKSCEEARDSEPATKSGIELPYEERVEDAAKAAYYLGDHRNLWENASENQRNAYRLLIRLVEHDASLSDDV